MRGNAAEPGTQEWGTTSRVPVAQILESRAAFPSLQLSFDILLETEDSCHGLEFCARIARKGLHVTHLVYRKPGSILVQFQDDRAIDVKDLAALFAGSYQVSLLRWTTILARTT